MDKLYIIGNGFDIAHDIPSKYSDFREYCHVNILEMYEKLDRYYNDGDKLWSDFENELPNINENALLDWIRADNGNWNQTWAGYNNFIDELRSEVDYIGLLKTDFTEWIQSITLNGVRRRYQLQVDNSVFLTFNYTRTLEDVYNVPEGQILHIHGAAQGEFPKLVVGHGKSDAEIENNFTSTNEFEEEALKEVRNLVRGWRKDTAALISAHDEFFGHLHDVREVYVLGHSLADVDLPYFQKVKEMVNDTTHWCFSYFVNPQTQESDLDMKQNIVYTKLHLNENYCDWKQLDAMLLVHEGDLF